MSRVGASLESLPAEATAVLTQLGARLRAHRMARGWTLAEAAQRLLCSPTTLRALESGRSSTSVGLMAHALWLYGMADGLNSVASVPASLLTQKRVRRRAGQSVPGVIAEDERDF